MQNSVAAPNIIYSIYLKMQHKNLELKDIYDYSAIRILVPTLEDCYKALSIVHSLWPHVDEEFDDYISKPKPNGYRSIHTAVIDPDGKNLEIQIRTKDMHTESEHGVAAHWLYKEKKSHLAGYETKITFLRQLLDWQSDVTQNNKQTTMEETRVYVFTPEGDVIDLTLGATPLDFAYHIHSDVGHHCRGAKVNGHIVPLTYQLKTGDKVEILTHLQGTPSRSWLSPSAGYLKTARARSKVMHWFKQQDIDKNIAAGKEMLERELQRLHIPFAAIEFEKIAKELHYKTEDAIFAAFFDGQVRLTQIMHAIQHTQGQKIPLPKPKETVEKKHGAPSELQVAGIDDLLTRIALCCKPIPGDNIVGFITQGRGVSIHRADCSNIVRAGSSNHDRIIQVSWDSRHAHTYYVDLRIMAHGRAHLLKDITALLANAKVDLVSLHSTLNKKNNTLIITATIQTHDVKQLDQLSQQLTQIPNIIDVKRLTT